MRLNVIATAGENNPQVWHEYLRMLLKREDYGEAERVLRRLQKIDPRSTSTLELTARVLAEKGDVQRATLVIRELLPRSLADIDKDERARRLAAIERVGLLLTDLGILDDAEKVYRQLYKLSPSTGLSLAEFLGTHREAEEAFAILKKIRDALINASMPRSAVIEKGLRVIARRGTEIDPSFAKTVGEWLDAELRENPGSIGLMVFKARYYEITEKYQEARDTYLGLLERPGLSGVHRAVVLNNLAFLLASVDLAPGDADRAEELVEEAIGILGPTTDILDTRGLVRLAQGRVDEAISDFELSVTDKPSAEKYFHLVEAYLAANRHQDAARAWANAEELQLSPAKLNGMRRPSYQSTKEKIENIRREEGTSA